MLKSSFYPIFLITKLRFYSDGIRQFDNWGQSSVYKIKYEPLKDEAEAEPALLTFAESKDVEAVFLPEIDDKGAGLAGDFQAAFEGVAGNRIIPNQIDQRAVDVGGKSLSV